MKKKNYLVEVMISTKITTNYLNNQIIYLHTRNAYYYINKQTLERKKRMKRKKKKRRRRRKIKNKERILE
jgi:hypothetical protein